jgi:type II secretory pathway component PulF
MALAARRMSELRRAVGLSVVYPTFVLCIALLEMPLLADVLRTMLLWLRDGRDDIPGWLLFFERGASSQLGWWIAIPCVVVLLFLLFGMLSSAGIVRGGWRTNVFRWFPWVRSAIDNARRAHFADQLALLVEQGVPLDESLRIVSEATVDPVLKRDALGGAEAIASGKSLAQFCTQSGAFTPLLRWLMAGGAANQILGRSLRHAAGTYQRRAMASADAAKIYLPSLLTGVIGGGVVVAISVLVIWPWTHIWYQLAQ